MPDEQGQAAATPEGAEAAPKGAAGKTKEKRAGGDKPRRSHGERAMANIRAAKRGQREVSEPAERARFLLAEANVLALLDVADALSGGSGSTDQAKDGEPTASE
jgi:hypothetical protein